jgi:hypothetical protein
MEFTASGTSIVFAIGADLPARTIVSNTASKAAESDDPDGTIGFISSPHSPKFFENHPNFMRLHPINISF